MASQMREAGLGTAQPYQPLEEKPLSGPSAVGRRCKLCLCASFVVGGIVWLALQYFCRVRYVPLPVYTAPLVDAYLGGNKTLNWWNLPFQRSREQLSDCEARLEAPFVSINGLEYGSARGEEALRLAYECTKVPGIIEQVPEQLRGVFWMKGNSLNEEIVVLQNGQWFPDERIYVAPLSPFSWAWAGIDGSRPEHAPNGGFFYRPKISKYAMQGLATIHTGFSFAFQECPGSPDLPKPFGVAGHACDAGSGDVNLTYAVLNAHTFGNLEAPTQGTVTYTLEAEPDAASPGNEWHRGIYGSLFGLGGCRCVSVGSYQLVRVIDGEGRPVEPYYSDFLRYIGDVPLTFWSNYTDPDIPEFLKEERYEEAWDLMHCSDQPESPECVA